MLMIQHSLFFLRPGAELNRRIEVLQTSALPLGDVATPYWHGSTCTLQCQKTLHICLAQRAQSIVIGSHRAHGGHGDVLVIDVRR